MMLNEILKIARGGGILAFAVAISLLTAGPAAAHCDGLDGPVVTAAQRALDSGDVNLVLIWVKETDEAEIVAAFRQTLAVRALGPAARDLAGRYFFETLVRIHRAGEGAAFTGLKPAGRDLGPAIPAADKAIEAGSDESLVKLLTDRVAEGLRERFAQAKARRNFAPNDVAAGREYVETYVGFIHYVERLYEAATHSVDGHYAEAN